MINSIADNVEIINNVER